jgi:hypothetical protein
LPSPCLYALFGLFFTSLSHDVLPSHSDCVHPDSLLGSVADFVYSSHIEITASILPSLAAIAAHFEMPQLSALLLDVLPQKVTFDNALDLVCGLVGANLPQYTELLIPFFEEHFRHFRQANLFWSMSPGYSVWSWPICGSRAISRGMRSLE